MAKYDRVDLALSDEGDLIIENGDFKVVRNQEFVNQSIRNRIKSSDPEWFDHVISDISANLEDLKGMPNSEETARLGTEKIGECISRDGLVEPDDIYIEPAPFDRNTIVFFIFVNTPFDSEPVGFEVSLNLRAGVKIRGI